MLYNDGQNLNHLYFKGPVGSIYYEGNRLYPSLQDTPQPVGILEGYDDSSITVWRNYTPSSSATAIRWADSLPHNPESIGDISRRDLYSIYWVPLIVDAAPATCSDYDDTATYSIGDAVFLWDIIEDELTCSMYTCIEDIDTPEPFDSSKWISMYYPTLGKYDSTRTYHVGDVVYYNWLATCIHDIESPEAYDSSHWISGFYPKLQLFHPNHEYDYGDVVFYSGTNHTCVVPHTSVSEIDLDNFISGYYPEILGIWDEYREYSVGDVVRYNYQGSWITFTYVYDYPSTGHVPNPSQSDYWYPVYAPQLRYIKEFNKFLHVYDTGDIVGMGTTAFIFMYGIIPKLMGEPKIFAWMDDNILYLYSSSSEIKSYFKLCWNNYYGGSSDFGWSITDISAFSHIDTSYTFSLLKCLYAFYNLTDISPLANWDVHNVKTFRNCFAYCHSLSDLSPISGWDVSSALDTFAMFEGCYSITILDDLNNWRFPQLANMERMFNLCESLVDISAIANWEIPFITTMAQCFAYCHVLTSVAPLEHLNMSKCTSLQETFRYCYALTDISPLAHWDMSGLSDWYALYETFDYCTSLTEIEDLHWDMTSMTSSHSLSGTFSHCTSLTVARELYWTNTPEISDIFTYCSSLVKVDFSRCTTKVKNDHKVSDFWGCENLEYCDFGDLFTHFPLNILPGNRQRGSLTDCTKIKIIILRNTKMVIRNGDNDGLKNLNTNRGTLYVPRALVDTYKNNSMWKKLNKITITALEDSIYAEPGSL